jgi:SulP family sulfate permease
MRFATLRMAVAARAPCAGDAWGGMAAMLVALPASIAFGVTVYAALGPAFAAQGAVAGMVGATVIGLLASWLGGTDRLISAPCAPAAAVLSAFAMELVHRGVPANTIVSLMVLVGVIGGVTQLALGLVGIGGLIRYIPYPVVSGYLTAVGLIIIGSQIPKMLGMTGNVTWYHALLTPAQWDVRAIVIAAVTTGVATGAPRVIRHVPGIIVGILAGIVTFGVWTLVDPSLRLLEQNPLVIGALGIDGGGLLHAVERGWGHLSRIDTAMLPRVLGTALTLGVLLSVDTLKTCVVLDRLTRSRHDSNRELRAQGIANLAANVCGGISGAGQMAATLVGVNAGARSRAAGIVEGALTLLAALLLSQWIAWIPVAALAGILMVIGVRMIDREPLQYLDSRETMLDFAVVVTVVVVALTVSLLAASAVGVELAMILYVREQIGSPIVRHKAMLAQTSSSWHRPEREVAELEARGDQAMVFELQGSLFFGNTHQLYADLEQEIATRRYVVIDLRRVRSIDVTAAQLFRQVRDTIRERGATLVFSGLREHHRSGRNLREFLGQNGVWHPDSKTVRIFSDLDAAVGWVEDRLLGGLERDAAHEPLMELREMESFAQHQDDTLAALAAHMDTRHYAAGDTIYARGSAGDELFWVRRGVVRNLAPLDAQRTVPVATFGRGDVFGGLAFMDAKPRPHDAIALTDTDVFVLTREHFTQLARVHHKLAFNLANQMARIFAMRLRRAERKISMLQEF